MYTNNMYMYKFYRPLLLTYGPLTRLLWRVTVSLKIVNISQSHWHNFIIMVNTDVI